MNVNENPVGSNSLGTYFEKHVALFPHQLILFGPPGAGKSHCISKSEGSDSSIAALLKIGTGEQETFDRQTVSTVFHPEYSHGDFMGKLLPLSVGDRVTYSYYEGHLLAALAEAYRQWFKHRHEKPEGDLKARRKSAIDSPIQGKAGSQDGANGASQANLKNKLKEIVDTPDSGTITAEQLKSFEEMLREHQREEMRQKDAPNVLLVLDELNRGNTAAIFGTALQWLDRDENGWSSHPLSLPTLQRERLFELAKFQRRDGKLLTEDGYEVDETFWAEKPGCGLRLPPNLYIVGTMNTSDESIFYMDSAFKRRWSWLYVNEDGKPMLPKEWTNWYKWEPLRQAINIYIKKNADKIRGVEDKILGHRFLAAENDKVSEFDLRGRLLFFLWDSVFPRNRKLIAELLGVKELEPVTFGDLEMLIHREGGLLQSMLKND